MSNETPPVRRLPRPEVWAEARRRETGRDPDRDAAVNGLIRVFWERGALATLAAAAQRHPDKSYLLDGDRSVSYAAFLRLVMDQAATLRAAAAPAGPVAFLARQTTCAAAAVFACVAVGRPCVALDPDGPMARNLALLRTARAAVLALAEGEDESASLSAALVPGGATVWLPAPHSADNVMPNLGDAIPATTDVDAPAFIFATSGSTGSPKLIVHSQRTASYLATLYSAAVLTDDRLLCVSGAPGSYSATLYLLTTAQRGASLHLADLRSEGFRRFLDRLVAERMTVLRAGASLFRTLAMLPEARAAMTTLRSIRLAGEPTAQDDVRVLRPLVPADCLLVNTYAATECMSFSCLARADDDHDATRVPAGYVELGGEAAVLDEYGALCEPGEVGELAVRSRYNALGEWVDGRLVQGRLVPDPLAAGMRVYFTGDQARASKDGCIVVLGRMDRMLKINGQRVEPMEVEVAIRELADVHDVIVLPRVAGAVTSLAAFVVPGPRGRETVAAALRERLRRHLPIHMLPARIVTMDALPRLANGKVDGVALLAGLD